MPVSVVPADGTWPTGSAAWEKRNIALEIPVWEEDLCIHCGKCPFVCPHSAIRSKVFPEALAKEAPPTFKHVQGLKRANISAIKSHQKIVRVASCA